jgi:ABC-type multidrug transport system ATPase subunit
LSNEYVVDVRNVSHVYSNNVVALNNVNLKIRRGEFFGDHWS